MRPSSLGLALALLLMPSAQAWDDPAADHKVGYMAAGGVEPQWTDAAAAGWYPPLDIVRAGFVEETEELLILEIEVAGLAPGTGEPEQFEAFDYTLEFMLKGELRRGVLMYAPDFDFTFFSLQHPEEQPDGSIWWEWDMGFPVEMLEDAPGWRIVMDKSYVRDSDYVPVREGDVFEDVRVWARDSESFYSYSFLGPCMNLPPDASDPFDGPDRCGWTGRDPVGDGGALGSFTVEKSPQGAGHLFLRVPAPFRGSNGLATTYLFELELHNLEAETDRAFLQLGDVPSGWEVHMPAVVDLPGESKQTVPVAVTVPFKHSHGQIEMVEIRAASERDPAVGTSGVVGIIYTDPPQPAGHHDTLYLHANGWGWMNAGETDPDALEGDTIGPNYVFSSLVDPDQSDPAGSQVNRVNTGFYVPLSPGLFTGLDFDLARPLGMSLGLQAAGAFEGMFDAYLVLYDYEEDVETVLASMDAVPLSIPGGSSTTVEADLDVLPVADRLPYKEGTNLALRVWANGTIDPASYVDRFVGVVQGERGFQPDVALQSGVSRITLPLFDYHETVPQDLLDALTTLTLSNRTETFKLVNPGRSAAFAFAAGNSAGSPHGIAWEVTGENAAWAEVFPARSTVPSEGNATVVVTVTPPEGAAKGEVADLVLVGRSEKDPDVQVFARLVAAVETDQDIPDESELAQELQDEAAKTKARGSPGLGLAAIATALLAVAWRRRA